MSYRLAAVCLSPILFAQGKHVRRVTPKLPEPAGARRGVEGAGEALRVLIAGDSSAAGVGVEHQSSALSGQLASLLAARCRLSWRLIARNGNKARDVLRDLESTPGEPFDMAIVAVGVNDVTGATSLRRWREEITRLCECLRSRFGVRHIFLICIPPMQTLPTLPQPLAWILGKRAQSLNRAMREWAETSPDCECMQPVFPHEQRIMAADGYHPGPVGYAIWAEQMAAAILAKCSGKDE